MNGVTGRVMFARRMAVGRKGGRSGVGMKLGRLSAGGLTMLSWFDVSVIAREKQAEHLRQAEQDRMVARSRTRRGGSLWEKLRKRLGSPASPPRKRRLAANRRACQEDPEVLAI